MHLELVQARGDFEEFPLAACRYITALLVITFTLLTEILARAVHEDKY